MVASEGGVRVAVADVADESWPKRRRLAVDNGEAEQICQKNSIDRWLTRMQPTKIQRAKQCFARSGY